MTNIWLELITSVRKAVRKLQTSHQTSICACITIASAYFKWIQGHICGVIDAPRCNQQSNHRCCTIPLQNWSKLPTWDPGPRPRSWYQVFGTNYLVPGTLSEVPGTCSLTPGTSTRWLITGTWYKAHGSRYLVQIHDPWAATGCVHNNSTASLC